jgi:DNA-binding GntR family transcriptional regulator
VKGSIAGILREEIVSGRLAPGEQIVEGRWAAKLKVAQASIREALNILAAEGFVQKELGRSARVTALSEEDVIQIHQVRTSLESLAARLVAVRMPDLSEFEQALADMHSAVQCGNVRTYCERDLYFHLLLCEKSGNRFLLEHVRRLIVPLFAFIVLRQHAAMANPNRWRKSYEEHRHILQAISSGNPDLAEREVAKSIQKFSVETVDLLGKLRGLGSAVADRSKLVHPS